MSRKKEAPRYKRRGQEKSSSAESNKRDLLKMQSPWASAPVDNSPDDIVQRSQADADRLEATCFDDGAWFDANPGRCFHLRQGTPHERDTGLACGWVLVARYSEGRVRLPLPFPELAGRDASKHDTEEKGRELFDWLTWGYTAENAHPFLLGVLEEIGGARHG